MTAAIEAELRTSPPRGLLRVWDLPVGTPVPTDVPGTPVPTLTAWEDLESAFRFSYRHPVHRAALGRRRAWFPRRAAPLYVLWHAARLEDVDTEEAVRRWLDLARLGPGPGAFDFLHPFDTAGAPFPVSRLRVDEPEAKSGGVAVPLPLTGVRVTLRPSAPVSPPKTSSSPDA